MANLIKYINNYKDKTFKEEEFNEIDNAILSLISYVDYDGIIYNNTNKIKMYDVGKIFFSKYNKKIINKQVIGVKAGIKVLKEIYDKKRYKDLELYNYVYEANENLQFSAVCINIDKKRTFISFEGTDDLISGWYEDAKMAYFFPVDAQRKAIEYLNKKVSIFSDRIYYVGGHSKGANLALVSSMYASPLVRVKIKKVYMNDGPGLRKKQIESLHYKLVEKKLIQIIPNYSVVGLLLRNNGKQKVIISTKSNRMAHDILTWQINDNKFIETSLSAYSKRIQKTVEKWLNNYNDDEREEFINNIFYVLKKANISSLVEFKSSLLPNIHNVLKEMRNINPKTKKIIFDLFKFFAMYLKEDTIEYFHNKISKKTS